MRLHNVVLPSKVGSYAYFSLVANTNEWHRSREDAGPHAWGSLDACGCTKFGTFLRFK
jgi:hypothetical protein